MIRSITALGRPCLALALGLGLGLGGLACTLKSDACEETRELIELGEPVLGGLSPELAVAEFAASPTPTLTWHEPAILDDAWGVPNVSIDHAGQCTTPLHVELELREDDSVWVEPDDDLECGPPVLLVPVHITITSEDGIFAIDTEGGVVGFDEDFLRFTVLLDAVPEALSLQIGPANPQREAQLAIEARLVDGQIGGVVRLISHDCGPDGACTYYAEHILASFG